MEAFELNVAPRNSSGSSAARKTRRDGKVPAVVYSAGGKAISFEFEFREFKRLAEKSMPSQVFAFKSDDATINGTRAVVKDIQWLYDPERVVHVDFQALIEGRPITVRCPIRVTGDPQGVKLQGGVLTVNAREVKLTCDPSNIPQVITIDVTPLTLGASIHARDLELPKGSSLAGNPDESVATVLESRTSKLSDEKVETAATPAAK